MLSSSSYSALANIDGVVHAFTIFLLGLSNFCVLSRTTASNLLRPSKMMTARTIPSKFPKAEEDDDGTHDSVDLSKHDSPHDSVEIRVRPSKKMMTARTTPSIFFQVIQQ